MTEWQLANKCNQITHFFGHSPRIEALVILPEVLMIWNMIYCPTWLMIWPICMIWRDMAIKLGRISHIRRTIIWSHFCKQSIMCILNNNYGVFQFDHLNKSTLPLWLESLTWIRLFEGINIHSDHTIGRAQLRNLE